MLSFLSPRARLLQTPVHAGEAETAVETENMSEKCAHCFSIPSVLRNYILRSSCSFIHVSFTYHANTEDLCAFTLCQTSGADIMGLKLLKIVSNPL